MHEPEQDEELDVLDFSNATRRFPTNEYCLPNTNAFCASLERNYEVNRDKILSPEGFIRTPMNALRELGKEWKLNIHSECNEIQDVGYKLYVVEVTIGHMIGYGECTRRKMASYMAAADILDQVKRKHEWIVIPEYGLPPGCRISPAIFKELLTACRYMGAGTPVFRHKDSTKVDPPRYTFECQVGQLFQDGFSDSLYLAKRWAAFNMFQALTGSQVRLDRVCSGPICKETLNRFNIVIELSPFKLEGLTRTFTTGEGTSARDNEIEDDDYTVLDFDEELDRVEEKQETRPLSPDSISEELANAMKGQLDLNTETDMEFEDEDIA